MRVLQNSRLQNHTKEKERLRHKHNCVVPLPQHNSLPLKHSFIYYEIFVTPAEMQVQKLHVQTEIPNWIMQNHSMES